MSRWNYKAIIKQKYFIFTLVLGIACITTCLALFLDIFFHFASCITSDFTSCSMEGYRFCIRDGYGFCCETYRDVESCGKYIGSCKRESDGYIQCDGVIRACWILGVSSILIFVVLIVMLNIHQKRRDKHIAEEETMQENENKSRQDQILYEK